MGIPSLQDIEHAIQRLEPGQLEELSRWFEQHYSRLVDARIESDLAAGRLDRAINSALSDEQNNRLKPL